MPVIRFALHLLLFVSVCITPCFSYQVFIRRFCQTFFEVQHRSHKHYNLVAYVNASAKNHEIDYEP